MRNLSKFSLYPKIKKFSKKYQTQELKLLRKVKRINKFIFKQPKGQLLLSLFCLILLLGSLQKSHHLRSIGYDQIPESYIILDERTWVWQGLSLRQTGIPAGWSQLGAYKKGEAIEPINIKDFSISLGEKIPSFLNYRNEFQTLNIFIETDIGKGLQHILLVQPLIEQPPLGGILLSLGVSENVKTFADLTATEMRRSSLYLAIFTQILIFLLGWQIYKNPIISLIASALYGSVPVYILMSHYAFLENALVPVALLSLNLLYLYYNLSQRFSHPKLKKSPYQKYILTILILAGISTGLTTLTKITGWFLIPVTIISLYYWQIPIKKIILFASLSITIGLSYFAWALYISPKLLLDIYYFQSLFRDFIGSLNFLTAITQVSIWHFPFEGWWLAGFIALFFLKDYTKEHLPIILYSICALSTALFLGASNFPWYFIPLIPVFCLSIAYFFWQVLTRPAFKNIFLFFLIFFSASFYWGYGVYKAALPSTNYQQPFNIYRGLFLFFLFFSTAFAVIKNSTYLKVTWFLIALFLIYYLIWVLNERSLFFILKEWGKYPAIITPGTFPS